MVHLNRKAVQRNDLSGLFLGFLKVGCFAFGGAYGAIPLIRDVVMSYGWLNDEMMNVTVIAESTPGPIAINCATFTGYKKPDLLVPCLQRWA